MISNGTAHEWDNVLTVVATPEYFHIDRLLNVLISNLANFGFNAFRAVTFISCNSFRKDCTWTLLLYAIKISLTETKNTPASNKRSWVNPLANNAIVNKGDDNDNHRPCIKMISHGISFLFIRLQKCISTRCLKGYFTISGFVTCIVNICI